MRWRPSTHAVMWLIFTVAVVYKAATCTTDVVFPAVVCLYGIACYLFGGNHVMDQWVDYMEAEEQFLKEQAAKIQESVNHTEEQLNGRTK